ncbi:MAG: LysM peptidoglycan-binding domain-containing protein [Spirochaetaceae bacterium]|nr:LysM peptidoglycan-binding domain-containing protein [Spirochaetaceae bacterium]
MKNNIFIIVFIIIFPSLLFSSPLPFRGEINNKVINIDTVKSITEKQNWLDSLQTHSGKEIFTFNFPHNELYNFYLEKYSSPEQIRWLDTVMQRADIYIDFIDDLVHKNDIPHEILYLPVIESAYRQNAVSRSGAAGMWQFMKNSISPYDMKIDDFTDERRDFWKATEGAIAKLKYNYDMLNKDWLLALAAYNCGLNRVKKTIDATGIADYWQLCEKGLLPNETIHYIPRLLAISKILSHRGRNGVPVYWRSPYRWERIKLSYSVSVTKLSEVTSIPVDIIKKGNAELHYDITPSGRDYFLKVPEGHGSAVQKAMASLDGKLMKFYFYQIKKGDTLYDISRHYGVSVSMIEGYNKGIDSSFLHIGQKLVIPALKDVPPYTGKRISVEASKQQVFDDPEKYKGSYVVKPGDTLWSIARMFKTDPSNIAHHNGILVDGVLSIGMKLKVPETDS